MQLSSVVLPEPDRPDRHQLARARPSKRHVAQRVHVPRPPRSRTSSARARRPLVGAPAAVAAAHHAAHVPSRPSAASGRRSGHTRRGPAPARAAPVAQLQRVARTSRGSCTRPARSSTAYSSAISSSCAVLADPRAAQHLAEAVRPSRIATVRPTCAATAGSWVTTTTVTPSSRVDGPQRGEHLAPRSPVQLAGRLVGEQHLRLVGERDRDRAPAAARRRTSAPAGGRRSTPTPTTSSSSSARCRARPRRVPAGDRHRQRDVLRARSGTAAGCAPVCCHTKPTVSPPVAQPRSAATWSSRSWPATRARPAVGTSSPDRMLQQRRLARAGRADDRDQLAAVDQQVEPLQRDHLDALGLVDPHQVVADDVRARAVRLGRALVVAEAAEVERRPLGRGRRCRLDAT